MKKQPSNPIAILTCLFAFAMGTSVVQASSVISVNTSAEGNVTTKVASGSADFTPTGGATTTIGENQGYSSSTGQTTSLAADDSFGGTSSSGDARTPMGRSVASSSASSGDVSTAAGSDGAAAASGTDTAAGGGGAADTQAPQAPQAPRVAQAQQAPPVVSAPAPGLATPL